MTEALKNEPERDFPIPAGIRFEAVDKVTGCPPEDAFMGTDLKSVPGDRFEICPRVFQVPLKEDQILCQGEKP
jgi:penicillin-binding protein 1A